MACKVADFWETKIREWGGKLLYKNKVNLADKKRVNEVVDTLNRSFGIAFDKNDFKMRQKKELKEFREKMLKKNEEEIQKARDAIKKSNF